MSVREKSAYAADEVDSWRHLKAGMLQERRVWLVRMRWVAILGVVLVAGLAGVMGWVQNTLPVFATALFMAGYNLVFWRDLRTERESGDVAQDELTFFLPLLTDLAALTLLLHWSGGIENPFALFFAFHMAIGATLLSTRLAYVLGLTGALFWGGTVLLESWGILPHHRLFLGGGVGSTFSVSEPSEVAIAGYLTAFVLMLFGVIHFVRTVEQGRWDAEARAFQRERLALSRDRMARIGEITAGVAHTVRNPLQGVMGCLDLLRDSCGHEDETKVELLEMMDEGLQRVERVTRRLLTLTRERQLALVESDLNELIEESLKFLGAKAAAKGVALETRLADLPSVLLDPDGLSEVLMNLADNAIQACSSGDRVLIETALAEPPVRAVSICICDTGSGIPAEQVPRVFDPFFTTKAVGEGSGLGLTIVREVVAGHMGSVRVLSDPAWGCCFRIVLPLDPANAMNQGVEIDQEQDLGPCC